MVDGGSAGGVADDFQTLHEIVKAAKARLSEPVWDYIVGGAETETTLKRNRQAFDSLAFRPRVLRDVEHLDPSGTLLGKKLRIPVFLAPIGSLQDITEGGGVTATRAAAKFGIAHMLSSVCKPGLEAVAEAADSPKIFQLYVRGDADWVDGYVRRAMDHGYYAFCLTVDLDHYSRRERDIAKRFLTTGRSMAKGEEHQARFTWDDVKRIKDKFDVPLILKGIATAEDAALCVEHGVDAVHVSNHGGRQLDHGRGAADVMPEIVAAVGGKAQVILDGGIMRGTDVVKAMALGADAVAIGRLQGLALGAAGEAGLVRALDLLEEEINIALALLGVRSCGELDPSFLHAAAPVGPAHVLSALPLLDEPYEA